MALFSFIGVEVAAITAKRVKNPRRNVGRASLLGTGASAILYLVVSAAIMGLVSHHALIHSTAPFVTRVRHDLHPRPGPASWWPRWPSSPASAR